MEDSLDHDRSASHRDDLILLDSIDRDMAPHSKVAWVRDGASSGCGRGRQGGKALCTRCQEWDTSNVLGVCSINRY